MKPTLMIALEIPTRITPHVLILSAHTSAPVRRGFTGGQCETKISFCMGKMSDGKRDGPCRNGVVCMDHFRHYTCKFKPGFTGENCTVNIYDCVDNMSQV